MHSSLKRLRLFVAVYEERSFTAAATRENATQSGISQHIHKLEEQLGVSLFTRGTASVLPTPAGNAYYQDCIELLRTYEQANSRIGARYGNGIDGEIVVGVTPTMARTVLTPTLVKFIDANPNVIIRVVDSYANIVTDKVKAGEVSFALVPTMTEASGVKSTHFASTQEFFVSGRNTGRQHLEPLLLSELGPLKIVLPSTAQSRRSLLEKNLIASGAKIEQRLEIDTMFGTLDFIANTDWVAILPGIMLLPEIESGQLLVHPIKDVGMTLDIFQIQVARAPLSPAAIQFLETMKEETTSIDIRIKRALAKS